MLDFALMLIDEYVRYPIDNLDTAWFPFNYCMLPYASANDNFRTIMKKLLAPICDA